MSNTTTAWQNMEDQCEKNDGYGISLDAMWRAVGSPPDKSPARWLELAAKFIEGMEDYRDRLLEEQGRFRPDGNERLIWHVTIESLRKQAEYYKASGMQWEYDDFERDGDTLTVQAIARTYQLYLDHLDNGCWVVELL